MPRSRSRSRDRRRRRSRSRSDSAAKRKRRDRSRDRRARRSEKSKEEHEIAKRIETEVTSKFNEHIASEEFKVMLREKLNSERQRLESLLQTEMEFKKRRLLHEFTQREEETSRSKLELENILLENQRRVLEEQKKVSEEQEKNDQMFRVEVERIRKQRHLVQPQGPLKGSGKF